MNRLQDKLVLFDIDGTLLDTHGLGRQSFIRGLAKATGEEDDLGYISFAGNTDLKVLDEVMRHRKIRFCAEKTAEIFSFVAIELQNVLVEQPGCTLNGVAELLAELKKQGAILGLATGNTRDCAYLKLKSVGLDEFFKFGGFGDMHASRTDIVHESLKIAEQNGWNPAESGVCLIGDTVFDIKSGVENGITAFGVASGRHGIEELVNEGAEQAAKDFSDTRQWLEWIESAGVKRLTSSK